MEQQIILLGTEHRLQGAEKRSGNIDDPDYRRLVEQLASEFSVEFILEEASDLGPTTAEKLALEKLGPHRYRDVDPGRNARPAFGIPSDAGETYWIGRPDLDRGHWGCARQEFVDAHAERERYWLQRVREANFKSALMICGQVHALSFGFRLQAEGLVVKAFNYMPYELLGRRV